MEAEADQRFRAKEQQLTQELRDTEQKLAQMPRAAEGSNDVLTPEQMKAIEGSAPNCSPSVPSCATYSSPCAATSMISRAGSRRERRRGAVGGGDHRIDIRNAPAATAGAGQGRAPIMNARQLIVLAGIAIVSVVATAAVMKTNATTVASDRRGETVVPALRSRANELAGVTVRDGNTTMAVERRDNGFVASTSGYPVKLDTVREIVTSSAELGFEEARTSDPTRYGDLGLADPGKGKRRKGNRVPCRQRRDRRHHRRQPRCDGGQRPRRPICPPQGRAADLAGAGHGVIAGNPDGWFVPLDFDVKRSEINSSKWPAAASTR